MNEEPKEEPIKEDNLGLDTPYADNLGGMYDGLGDMGGISPMEKHSDLLKELTNFDPIIQERIRDWLGLDYDEQQKDYIQKHPPIINTKGARWAIGFLRTYQSKTNFITNLNQAEYNTIKVEIIDGCWLVFPTKFDQFRVKDTADQWKLSNELQHSAFLVLAGAGDGKYTKFLGESVSRTESVSLNPSQPYQAQGSKVGWWDGLKDRMLGRK
jgi:hypothetical protein